MRRQIPFGLVFIFGIFMVFQFFVPHEKSEWIYEFLLDWIIVIGIFALALGIWSLFKVSVEKIKQGKEGGNYSYITLVGLYMMVAFGFTQQIPVSDEVRDLYNRIMETPAGADVLVSFDYGEEEAAEEATAEEAAEAAERAAAETAELQLIAESFMRFCFERDLDLIILGLTEEGPLLADSALQNVLTDERLTDKSLAYGVDYVNLGYAESPDSVDVITHMGISFSDVFTADARGAPLDELLLLKDVNSLGDVAFVFTLSAGTPGAVDWIESAGKPLSIPIAAGFPQAEVAGMSGYFSDDLLVGGFDGDGSVRGFEHKIIHPEEGWGLYFLWIMLCSACIVSLMRLRASTESGKKRMWALASGGLLVAAVLVAIFDDAWAFFLYTPEGLENSMFEIFFDHIMMPILATMFSLLAFYIASAAYRAFRARNVLASLLLLAALLVMSRFNPFIPGAEYVANASNWLMNVPNLAAQRAIVIGIGLGIVGTALKIILGIERGYMGRG
ncbi:MAG: hypothetical protein KAW46_05325 [candidate division Zixibacteria bacterium]|nr:hypothetical protein [candidate division Zixibacteria bacterium]